MNMNKTEKLLAARKRLKEYQQSKNHNHDNAASHQKDQIKTMPAELTQSNNSETLSVSSTHSPEKSVEIVNTATNDREAAGEVGLNISEGSRLAEEAAEPWNHLQRETEFKGDVKTSRVQEVIGAEKIIRDEEAVRSGEDVSGTVAAQRVLPSPPASPSPPRSRNSPENAIEDSQLMQRECLTRMGTGFADTLTNAAECTPAAAPQNQDTDHEYRNQFLASLVEQQKRTIEQLRDQAALHATRVNELENELTRKQEEFEARLARELDPLREELRVHARTTEILVAEKAELTATNEQYRVTWERRIRELEELNGRLKATETRVLELEREVNHGRTIVNETRNDYQRLNLDYAELEKKHNEILKSKDDDELETSELRRELSLRNAENATLRKELEENRTQLSLNELKIQQLSNTPQEIQALDGQQRALAELQQQLAESRESLKNLSREKDEAAKQYENYVRQLDTRNESTLKELEESRGRITLLEEQEKSYVRRLSDLESGLQRERQTVEKLTPLIAHEERVEHLTRSLDALSLEHANLQTRMNERELEFETLRRELEEARESREDSVDKVKLASALESEKLGASRAVSQNQQLKAQLNEMHDAFVTLSNSKLDLTEQLQAERTIGKKLNARLNKVEEEMDELKEQLRLKSIALEDSEREKLQTAQIADQMHHYQAQSNQAKTLQQELQNSLGCIEILRRENQQLSMRLNVLLNGENTEKQLSNGDDAPSNETDPNARKLSFRGSAMGGAMISDPLKKLEIRFKETMERVAELTDEKQRLEHLVLQLQGETETIGEYITLYQKQRAILQKKAKERDESFRQLVEQRNHQQEQLHQLKVLVAQLIKKKKSPSSTCVENDDASPAVIEFENEHSVSDSPTATTVANESDEPTIDVTDKTTSKILDLLSEIKDCKDTCILEPNFHPCPWCSGKLITV